MIGRAVAATIALVIIAAGLPAAQALAAPRASTPDLITKDVRSERIPPARGHLYRAYAIGRYDKLPSAYRSSTPWDGTLVLRDLRRAAERMKDGPTRREIESILEASASCSTETGALANSTSTAHYYVEYGTIGGGLTITSYVNSLETAWTTQVDNFGWAAPPVAPVPAPGSKYHVRIQPLDGGLYGFVSNGGAHAGFVGNNPNTAWNDVDSYASCMVLNNDYDPFPGTVQQALDATTAHEFNHSLQFGYGALSGANDPDHVFVEGGATWMEDEVFDGSNDNHGYLWPDFTEGMGDYDDSFPYPYWITFRGLTERYGTGVAGAGEDVMQRFWELTSQNTHSNLGAMEAAVAAEGTTLAEAFHAYAIAVGFNRACSGGYVLPYCFEEAAGYLAGAGALPTVHGSIATVGNSLTRTVENDYALSWITLPTTGGAYTVTVQSNESEGGPGRLRATAVCDTGLLLRQDPFALVTDGTSQVVPFDPAGCTRALLTVTNETKTADNPTNSGQRSYTVLTAAQTAEPPKTLTVSKDGAGTGTVTSSPAGINCGATCSAQFAHGTSVTLTAAPAADATFTGWSGACAGTGTCQVTMTEARSVTATFAAKPPTLTVTRAGTGTGTVTSDPAGIDCGSTCAAEFAPGTVVTLTATAAAGSTFSGWSGACTGTGSCQVTMTEARDVTATFTADPKTLDVAKGGAGTGTVTSSPAGIDCGATCSAQFAHGTLVTLSAAPAADATFAGWSGACAGTGICQVTMSEARFVTATFAAKTTADPPPPTAPPAIIPPSIPGPFPPHVDTTAPLFSLRTTRLRVTRSGRLRLPIGCSSGETAGCRGTVRLELLPGKRAAAARKSFRIGAGATRSVQLKLNRTARRRLVRGKRLRLRAIVVVTDAAGNARTVRRTLVIRLRR